MTRREIMKLASAAIMLPAMRGMTMAKSDNRASPLSYKVFTVTRPGLNRDVPPGILDASTIGEIDAAFATLPAGRDEPALAR